MSAEKTPSRSIVELYDRVAALEKREHERILATSIALVRLSSSLHQTLGDLTEQVVDLLDSLAEAQVGDGATGTTNAGYNEMLEDREAFFAKWKRAHERPALYPGTAVVPVYRSAGSSLPFPDAPPIPDDEREEVGL